VAASGARVGGGGAVGVKSAGSSPGANKGTAEVGVGGGGVSVAISSMGSGVGVGTTAGLHPNTNKPTPHTTKSPKNILNNTFLALQYVG